MKNTKRYVLYENHAISPIKMYVVDIMFNKYHLNSDIGRALKFNNLTELIRYITSKKSDTEIQLKVAIIKMKEKWVFNQRIK